MTSIANITFLFLFAFALISCRQSRELGRAEQEIKELRRSVIAAAHRPDSVVRIPGKIMLQTDTIREAGSVTIEKRFYRSDSVKVFMNNPELSRQLVAFQEQISTLQGRLEQADRSASGSRKTIERLLFALFILIFLFGLAAGFSVRRLIK